MRSFGLALLVMLAACGGAVPRPVGPSAFAACRSWALRLDTDVLRVTCGETDVVVSMRAEAYTPNIEEIVFPQIVAANREDEGFRATNSRIAVGGEYRPTLEMQSIVDSHMFYSRVVLQQDRQTRNTLQVWCSRYDQPVEQDCDVVANQLGVTPDFAALQASLPEDPESIERTRRRSIDVCTPTQRVDTTAYGTLDRVTELACDERTLFVGEEAGTLNDETRAMAFDRFRNAFGAINSWEATFDLNGVEHHGVHAERSDPDGTRVEGFIMLLPSTRDRHRLLVCVMPGDIDECSPLLEQLATMPGTGGMFGPSPETPSPSPAAPTEAPAAAGAAQPSARHTRRPPR